MILANAVPMFQTIYSTTLALPSNNPTLNIAPRYAGLIRAFRVVISGTIKNNDASNALALTDLGLANILSPNSGVVLTDLNNFQRINTAGWHLSLLNSAKHRRPYATGWALETDEMSNYGETFQIIQAPSTIAASGSATFRAVYDVPVSYSPSDLRGVISAGVVNSTMNLALTFNPTPFTATGTDSTFAVMKGTANATFQNVTVTVYQDYLDQIPMGPNGILLPVTDVGTVYELKNTMLPNIVANQDNPYPYAPFRSYLSTFGIYDNNPSGDSGRTAGTDVSYWAMQVANFTNLWKMGALDQAQFTRDVLATDYPKGVYYFASRQRPILTTQFGNQELVLNPTTSTGGVLYLGIEDFGNLAVLQSAGSLAA
jgi:hypothetical protein